MKANSTPFMNIVHFSRLVGTMLAVWLVLGSPSALANDPSRASQASQMSAQGSAIIARGSLTGITGSAEFVVASIQVVGDGLEVVLQGASEVGEVVLQLPRALVGGASLAVGESVTVIAQGAGWAIESAGKLIGFVPTEAGRALLYSERLPRNGI